MSAQDEDYRFSEADRQFICGVLIAFVKDDGLDRFLRTAIRRAIIGLSKSDDLLFEDVKKHLPPDSEWNKPSDELEKELIEMLAEDTEDESS